MPAAKKKTKKKAVTKKATKKLLKKKAAKKKVAAKKVAKKSTKKKSTVAPAKKKASKKQTTKQKNSATNKTGKKTAAKKPAKTNKKPVKKSAPKTNTTSATTKAAKKTKTRKINMTKTKNNTNISPPVSKKPTPASKPAIKEDKKMNVTMEEELEFAPYAINRGEDYMTDEQMEHFRKILLRWKQQLMQEVDSTVGHMKEEGLSYPDPVDRASQEEGFNLELRTRDRERKLIKKIESALDSIETGDYGFCEDCGADIGVRRLEARPTATKCIDCKTYQEIRERQAGG